MPYKVAVHEAARHLVSFQSPCYPPLSMYTPETMMDQNLLSAVFE